MPRPIPVAAPETPDRILAVAERLAQTRGFNGFSYADIAPALAITKASLHYHFATKAELGRALIRRYAERFDGALDALDALADPRERIHGYLRLWESVLVQDRMCLCGMLAAEYQTLPPTMQQELRRFFDRNEAWLAKTLEEGRKARRLAFTGSAAEAASALTAALEGAMLLARAYEQPARFAAITERLIAGLAAPERATGSRGTSARAPRSTKALKR
jgi:TetR/AcrR family transcriptional repressor of nem operon